ncbi:MAG: DNA polymerase I [Deltaproteobacteria bacterium CG11_big_fil_rev_8_21_14_0_20_45_16]|nr:MAG: DNA polymerase I [Deltaproteobacteria bacterium CG11_big_fil_rev_8_21_14_0_20_45_16]
MAKNHEVYLIDASAFIFRAYYALAPLSSKGRPSHAVAGFASMLLKLLREKSPKSCVVVFDSKKPSFRKEIYPEYKANREVPPPDLSGQIVAVRRMCEKAGFPILQEEGLEADDWIASFVRNAFPNEKVVIISSDKDLLQLVDKRVQMYDSFRDKRTGIGEVEEKWAVKPDQIRDLLALTGDSSDNIPGIEGVGPKTAAKLLNEYGSIDGIYRNLANLPEKQRAKFEAAKEAVKLSQKLVDLKDDLKIPFDHLPELPESFPGEFKDFLVDWDLHRILTQFADRLGSDSGNASNTNASSSRALTDLRLLKTMDDLKDLRGEIEKAKLLAFDCETSSFDRNCARVVGVSFCTRPDRAWYIPWNHGEVDLSATEMKKLIVESLARPNLVKLAHNAKYDVEVLGVEGIEVVNLQFDTMIEGHLLNADRRSVSLENLARDFLSEEKGDLKALLGKSENFADIPLDQAKEYAAQDAALTFKLHELFKPQLEADASITWVFKNLEMPLVDVLASMEMTGVRLDVDFLKALSKELHEKLEHLVTEIYRSAGREFNIASPKQLQEVLFAELKLPTTKKTKTGYSTDESVLQELASKHEIPRLILDYRKLAKLTSTYVDVLPDMVSARDGRLHTHYHQTGTATGRLSSSDPNLQNIPARSEEGMKIREAFIPEKSHVFLSADYSQVELRLMAHLSGDEKMIEAFAHHRDIHAETAKIIFGSSDKEFRSRAKAINFGVIYGISAYGLSQQLDIEPKEAKQFIDSYFEQFPKVKEYMDASIKLAKEMKFSETLFGRKRPLPDIDSKNPTLRQMAERIAINAPLQGTAADIMKYAMVRVHQELLSKKLKSRILLQVHDELVLEAFDPELDQIKVIVQKAMTDLSNTPGENLKVPLVVDISTGPNWAAL